MDPVQIEFAPHAVAEKTAAISSAMMARSENLREPNFTRLGVADLALLFELYDEQFFGGWIARTVGEKAGGPLMFRLSSTMTRAGGKTSWRYLHQRDGTSQVFYEIAIAGRMLMMSFGDVARPVEVCGFICHDRLRALQRIMEHEIVHLVEVLLCGKSSCQGMPFQELARRIFAHTGISHELVTPRERAAVRHGIQVGSLVEFDFEGARQVGRVNRIHQRATVLVESAQGEPYSDGKRYMKFYVPLASLRKL